MLRQSIQKNFSGFVDRYRLYIDESGDHVFRKVNETPHRFLCLLGCWFCNPDYLNFHETLEKLKMEYLPHHPDNPVILHREDMVNARKAFKALRDHEVLDKWNESLLNLISKANFRFAAVVIDKLALREGYADAAAHPYHLGLGFLLQRYAGFLNHINRVGDVLAESRGGHEDRLLKESYMHVFERGVWQTGSNFFQSALTSKELKLKPKSSNIAGLQLADLLVHPVKQWVLRQNSLLEKDLAPFAERLVETIKPKFNRQLYKGRIKGYGWVLFPKK